MNASKASRLPTAWEKLVERVQKEACIRIPIKEFKKAARLDHRGRPSIASLRYSLWEAKIGVLSHRVENLPKERSGQVVLYDKHEEVGYLAKLQRTSDALGRVTAFVSKAKASGGGPELTFAVCLAQAVTSFTTCCGMKDSST